MDNNSSDKIEEVFNRNDLHEAVLAVCCALYKQGIKEVHVGGLMRLLGVDSYSAAEHDEEIILLSDEDFMHIHDEDIISLDGLTVKIPDGTTIH